MLRSLFLYLPGSRPPKLTCCRKPKRGTSEGCWRRLQADVRPRTGARMLGEAVPGTLASHPVLRLHDKPLHRWAGGLCEKQDLRRPHDTSTSHRLAQAVGLGKGAHLGDIVPLQKDDDIVRIRGVLEDVPSLATTGLTSGNVVVKRLLPFGKVLHFLNHE